ncbi:MAG: hypothetical protein IPM39_15935 [Chloroflexi bacterium]|nr:hypothetical protein [Chloroflexota bacterium]
MNQTERDLQDVLEKLATLEPTAVEAPRAPRALAQIHHRLVLEEENRWQQRFRRFFAPSPARRLALTLAFVVVALLAAFSLPTVRAAAGEFLGLFRVQTFTAVSISPEQIALLQQLANEGLSPGQVNIIQEPDAPTPVATLDEAAAALGFRPRTVTSLGQPTAVHAISGGRGNFVINLAGTRAILQATGADPLLLPDSLDGARIDLTTFASVEQQWANGVWLIQSASPEVEYPAEIGDPTLLAEAFLRALGLEAAEARRLAREIDWTSTLLLPLPADAISFREIQVDGSSGLALQNLDGTASALVWQRNGVLYLLQGAMPPAELAALAASLN